MEVFLKRPVVHVKKESETSYRTTKLEFFPTHLRIDSLEGSQSLTYKESELLELFFRNAGQVIKREDILMKVWGTDDYYKGRSLDVFISRLRKFLQADGMIEIQTVHGVGFKFLIHST
jgi:DNA-binding response OmpR family regulator